MRRDYYAVLGVEATATGREIRQAYRRLARQYSPDVNLWDQAARALYAEITDAYRVLSDAVARSLYDRYGHQAFERDEWEGGRRPRRSGGVRGDDLHCALDLAFADAARGLSLALEVSRLSRCPACGASGSRRGAPAVTCDHCGGTGSVWWGERPHPEPCLACDGLGERVADPCPTCSGRGVSLAPATVPVTIPPGVDTGAQLRIPAEGHSGPFGGPRGDLVVITRVTPHAFFVRKGDNLHCEIPVALTEAVLGARIQVPTLEGSAVLVLPPGTQSGQVFRLRGKGLPRLDGERRGDLYVTVKVLIPRGLDARTEEIFRQLERLLPDNPRVALIPGAVPGALQAEVRR
ncbi:MAG: DnaJ domain-containing protein [Candidatus Rokubacteria bacterium]|nr:DnaJ domain-containing protein [Candidatus Rokubacteria bacterium]